MAVTLKKYLVMLAVILLIIFMFKKIGWLPSFGSFFKSKPLIIDQTPILIKEINNLAQLVTVSAIDEVVMDSVKKLKSPLGLLPPPTFKIVLIGKGRVMAGVDLKKLNNEDISITKDSIHIVFPPAQVLNTILNPSDFETFDETGTWSSEEVTQVKVRMRERMIQRATEQNLLSKATVRCGIIMESFLRNLGFKKIVISFRDQSP